MYALEQNTTEPKAIRLTSDAVLAPADFASIAQQVGETSFNAKKIGPVAARKVVAKEQLETHWNGKETEVVAEPGDWIVTALSQTGEALRDNQNRLNQYALKPATFARLYEPGGKQTSLGELFHPTGVVKVLFLLGGFDIVAPWGERQRADSGYLLLNGAEVYGNNKETFELTYQVLS